MTVQINTDSNIEGNEALVVKINGVVESALDRNIENIKRITRIEVHLSDEDAGKSGQNDKRCMMEARLEGVQPTGVTHRASPLDNAVDGAAGKLARLIEGTVGRKDHQAMR
jgi:ribosome-associated translation inhibitor RaiA